MAASKNIFLVLGGTGKAGSSCVAGLKAKGITDDQIRVASRHPTPDSNHVKFDWNDDSTWDAALQGATAVILIGPQCEGSINLMKSFIDLTMKHGIKRQVLFTGLALEKHHGFWGEVHRHFIANVPEYVVVRPSQMNQNFLKGGWYDEIVKDGHFTDAVGDSKCGFVDAADCGAAAADAITLPSDSPLLNVPEGYGLEGPIAYSYAEIAAIISKVSGKKIRYNDITMEEMRAARPANFPQEFEWVMQHVFEFQVAGKAALLTDRGFQRLTGREPKSFEVWAEENKDHWKDLPW